MIAQQIFYLVSRYPATNHTFILREITGLRSLGFDVHVISIRGADRPRQNLTQVEQQEQDRTMLVLPAGWHWIQAHLSTLLFHPLGYLRGLLAAMRFGGWNLPRLFHHAIYFAEAVVAGSRIKQTGAAHMHIHFSSTVGYIAAKIFGIGYSITIHGPDEFNDVTGFRMREKVAGARFIVAISHYGRSQIMRACDPEDWPKIHVCRLGVNPATFAAQRDGEPAGTPRIICVGRLAPVKAQQVLISACARLIRAGRQLKLHLVGSGPDRERLEAFAAAAGVSEQVVFEGPRNQDEVVRLYRQSHIFALASFAEGVPVVLMEAMAMQLPCIATWVNGVPELIEHQVTGILVPPGDETALTEAMARLLDDRQQRQKLGVAGREQVLQHYDLEANVALLADIFRQQLQQGRPEINSR